MVPTTRNLLHHDGNNSRSKSCYHSGQFCGGVAVAAQLEPSEAGRRDHHKPSRSPRLVMAEDAAAAGTSSRPRGGAAGAGDDGDWLQLGLAAASSSSTSSGDNNSTDPAPPPVAELDLFSYGKRNTRMRPPMFPLPLRSYQYGHGRHRPTAASGSMSAPFLPFLPPFRNFGDAMRVISPPRRTEAAGLWLTLQAAPNQVREPILPQIPKSYLRIKDSNMKVEMVMKYLAEKLGLTRSHQVELTCRGQLLPPFLLVKYVRDSIWCSSAAALREEEEALVRRRPPAATTTTDRHVMALCYSTSRNDGWSSSLCN